MRTTIAALSVALLLPLLATPLAGAAPTEVNVRIEGRERTLFEGPISTAVHRVRAASDSQWRRCNGINFNDPWNTTPAPVPTSTSADAMRIVSETFSAQWYNQYEDYFVTRWGPDEQNLLNSEQWGIVVNNVFTGVGGCQYQLDGGDEVLWIYNAFNGRPRLLLYPGDYAGGSLPLTATAALGQPFEVEVDSWGGQSQGSPPASPQRSSSPFEGAEVAPVETSAKGFERVETGSPAAVATGADGRASITFTDPGWHRIKAAVLDSHGAESAIRSNRLDVCVPQPPASGCGAPPVEDQLRTPPPPLAGEEEPGETGGDPTAGGGGQLGANGQAATTTTATADRQVRLELPRIDRSRVARGLVRVSWRVLDPGVGIKAWTVATLTLGRRGAHYVRRASGSDRSAATLRLPPGATYRLRLTVTDSLGRSSAAAIGKVQVPA
jgi:hypothetical protein